MQSSPWILSWDTPQDPACRLITFSHAGGGATSYRSWPRKLPHDVALHAIQLPGREQRFREPPIWRMDSLISGLLPHVLPLFDRPFVLFGHSLGAKIAYALCARLAAEHHPMPEHLLVSACRAPHLKEPRPLHNLPDDAFIQELGRFEGTDPAVLAEPELLACFLPMLRADFTIDETWQPTPPLPLPVPIRAFCATEDPEANEGEMTQWEQYTDRLFSISTFPGGHFYLRTNRDFYNQLTDILHGIRQQTRRTG